jgi:putative transposase
MLKTFEYRLHPTRRQREQLMACLMESRRLYNEMLESVREHYGQTGSFLFEYSLTTRFKGRGGEHIPATTVQTLARRLDKAIRRYLSRRELGQKVGFPRFKSANRWHSIRLRQYGKSRDVWLEDGRLRVPGKLGKSIKVKQHRPLEGTPKTAHLVLRADGKWYVLVVCEFLVDAPPTKDGPAIGLDVGLRVFLTDSEGDTIRNPHHYRRSQKKLRRKQRKLCRCNKGSSRKK